MVSISPSDAGAPERAPRLDKFYLAAWRWHFYAGLYVIPFLVMLAATGLLMLWISVLAGRDGERIAIAPGVAPLAVSTQAEAAAAALPGGVVTGYIAPAAADRAALFRVSVGEETTLVAVDPFTAAPIDSHPYRAGWYDLVSKIHGTLLLGSLGDRLIEIAASLGIVLVVTGLYLWWPRQGGLAAAFVPRLSAKGRGWWKSLHSTVGVWISLILVAFLVSGLSWAGIWGERFVQAWSTFPAEKWDAVPLSDKTHASMNHGAAKEVPWALEQTPMPASGSHAGHAGPGGATALAEGAVGIDSIVALARSLGFAGRFQLAAPKGDTGVWTISRDSMSNDSSDPTSDRTVHVDRYTGLVLADVAYADYSVYGKAMAVGIALHEGDLGAWNVALNTLFCLGVIFVAASGVVMWWKRRPTGAGRLAAPPPPRDMPVWKAAVGLGLIVSIAFPLAGLAILAALLVDTLLLPRLPAVKRLVS